MVDKEKRDAVPRARRPRPTGRGEGTSEPGRSSRRGGDKGRTTKIEKYKVIYSNVDGLVSKRLEIEDIIRNEEPMIICFCETKLNSEISLEAMCWRNYDV